MSDYSVGDMNILKALGLSIVVEEQLKVCSEFIVRFGHKPNKRFIIYMDFTKFCLNVTVGGLGLT